ncbi:MAG: SEL1-like repeat protein [Akkermansia sp.]|nr:SEL1-like repeat protein [Akkermansia sp.]
MAECYYTGRGVALDYDEAVHWFKKAAEQGHKDAIKALNSMK